MFGSCLIGCEPPVNYCSTNPACGGFTTRSSTCDVAAKNSSQIHTVYFESELTARNNDPVWRTWKKSKYVPPPPPPRLQVFAKSMADGTRDVVVLNHGPMVVNATLMITWQMVQLETPRRRMQEYATSGRTRVLACLQVVSRSRNWSHTHRFVIVTVAIFLGWILNGVYLYEPIHDISQILDLL